jgi:hypothetical protein
MIKKFSQLLKLMIQKILLKALWYQQEVTVKMIIQIKMVIIIQTLPRMKNLYVKKVIKIVWKNNLNVQQLAIKNAKLNKKKSKFHVLIYASISVWQVLEL